MEVALRVLELLGDPARAQRLVQARVGNWDRLAGLLQHSVFKVSQALLTSNDSHTL